ncbi:HNH endonuclease signature motif containing protein [Streptomyces sp. NPDC052396]|uniref:HNH endonuclease signature motif containing protein n=1 Tax=Streptomyces sp. NPDC052396 TaxID=3365689 RepID=UPI0037D67D84
MDTGTLCGLLATDVDHIEPGDNHDAGNLQALCRFHHAKKSATEGANAANAKRERRERKRESQGSARTQMLKSLRDSRDVTNDADNGP